MDYDSEDEIFFGPVTVREEAIAAPLRNRRTEIYGTGPTVLYRRSVSLSSSIEEVEEDDDDETRNNNAAEFAFDLINSGDANIYDNVEINNDNLDSSFVEEGKNKISYLHTSIEKTAFEDGSNVEDLILEKGSNVEDPILGKGSNVKDLAVGERSNVEDVALGTRSHVEDLALGEGSKEEALVSADGSNVEGHILREGSNMENLVLGEGSNVDLEVGEGSNVVDLAVGEGSNVEDLALRGGSNGEDLALGEGSNVEDLALGEGSNVEDLALGERSNVEDLALTEGSNEEALKLEEGSNVDLAVREGSNVVDLAVGEGSNEEARRLGEGSNVDLAVGEESNVVDLAVREGSNVVDLAVGEGSNVVDLAVVEKSSVKNLVVGEGETQVISSDRGTNLESFTSIEVADIRKSCEEVLIEDHSFEEGVSTVESSNRAVEGTGSTKTLIEDQVCKGESLNTIDAEIKFMKLSNDERNPLKMSVDERNPLKMSVDERNSLKMSVDEGTNAGTSLVNENSINIPNESTLLSRIGNESLVSTHVSVELSRTERFGLDVTKDNRIPSTDVNHHSSILSSSFMNQEGDQVFNSREYMNSSASVKGDCKVEDSFSLLEEDIFSLPVKQNRALVDNIPNKPMQSSDMDSKMQGCIEDAVMNGKLTSFEIMDETSGDTGVAQSIMEKQRSISIDENHDASDNINCKDYDGDRSNSVMSSDYLNDRSNISPCNENVNDECNSEDKNSIIGLTEENPDSTFTTMYPNSDLSVANDQFTTTSSSVLSTLAPAPQSLPNFYATNSSIESYGTINKGVIHSQAPTLDSSSFSSGSLQQQSFNPEISIEDPFRNDCEQPADSHEYPSSLATPLEAQEHEDELRPTNKNNSCRTPSSVKSENLDYSDNCPAEESPVRRFNDTIEEMEMILKYGINYEEETCFPDVEIGKSPLPGKMCEKKKIKDEENVPDLEIVTGPPSDDVYEKENYSDEDDSIVSPRKSSIMSSVSYFNPEFNSTQNPACKEVSVNHNLREDESALAVIRSDVHLLPVSPSKAVPPPKPPRNVTAICASPHADLNRPSMPKDQVNVTPFCEISKIQNKKNPSPATEKSVSSSVARTLRPAGAPRPTTGTPRPTTGTPRPTTGTPRPTTGTPRPTTGTPRPTTGTPRPTTGTPRPTTGAPRPTTGTPRPTTGAPRPTTGTPRPTIGAPRTNRVNKAVTPRSVSKPSYKTPCSAVGISRPVSQMSVNRERTPLKRSPADPLCPLPRIKVTSSTPDIHGKLVCPMGKVLSAEKKAGVAGLPPRSTPRTARHNPKLVRGEKGFTTPHSIKKHSRQGGLDIISPVARYLRENPPPPLIVNVKPRNRIQNEVEEESVMTNCEATPEKINEECKTKRTSHRKPVLPVAMYSSAVPVLMDSVENKENARHRQRQEIVGNGPHSYVMKHKGRMKLPKDLLKDQMTESFSPKGYKKSPNSYRTSVSPALKKCSARPSLMEVSVYEPHQTKYSNTLK